MFSTRKKWAHQNGQKYDMRVLRQILYESCIVVIGADDGYDPKCFQFLCFLCRADQSSDLEGVSLRMGEQAREYSAAHIA